MHVLSAALRLVVLARVLTPRDFGLFGLVALTVLTVETFTETGFNVALIRRHEGTEDLLDTAWTVQVVRGLGLAVALGVALRFRSVWALALGLLGENWRAAVLLGRLVPVRVPLLALACEAMATGALLCVGAGLAARVLGGGPFVQARQAWAAFRSTGNPPA